MLGGIISRLTGGGRRPTASPTGPGKGRRPVGGSSTGANREVERGARTLLKGLRRRR